MHTRSDLSRRAFLALSGGVVLAAALPAAGAGSIGRPRKLRAPAATVGKAAAAAGGDEPEISPLVLSSDLYASPGPQRFVFAVAVGPRYASTKRASIGFVPPGTTGDVGVAFTEARLYKQGLPKGRGVYVTDATFDTPGIWGGVLDTRGELIQFAIDVKAQPEAPLVGAAAPRAASPTKADPLGVKPICTRKPPCPLHTVSLADVIGAGTPVAAMFATPALCASQYCGPVLDELLDVRDRYADAITFVHIEIYTSNRGATRAPTVAAWNLPSEPWLFTIDGAGTIVGRLDGAFGQGEIVQSLDALAGRS